MGGTDLPLQARILLLNIDESVGKIVQRATERLLKRTYEFPTQLGRSVESLDGKLEGVDLVVMSLGNTPGLQEKSYAQLDYLVGQGTRTIVMSGGGNSTTAYARGANGYIASPSRFEDIATTINDVLTVGKDAERIRYDRSH
jgi:hypothetical protein